MVGSSGDVRDGNHVCGASAFLQFITRNDAIGSLGMAGMEGDRERPLFGILT